MNAMIRALRSVAIGSSRRTVGSSAPHNASSSSSRLMSTETGAATKPPSAITPRKRFHPLAPNPKAPLAWPSSSSSLSVPQPARVPPPIQPITTPAEFLYAIGSKNRKLETDNSLVGLLGEEWDKMWQLTSADFKKAGVAVKERRYVLWAMEKFRQGWKPSDFKIVPKPKKRVRGWGPRVQNGIRVRGVLRPGEKRA